MNINVSFSMMSGLEQQHIPRIKRDLLRLYGIICLRKIFLDFWNSYVNNVSQMFATKWLLNYEVVIFLKNFDLKFFKHLIFSIPYRLHIKCIQIYFNFSGSSNPSTTSSSCYFTITQQISHIPFVLQPIISFAVVRCLFFSRSHITQWAVVFWAKTNFMLFGYYCSELFRLTSFCVSFVSRRRKRLQIVKCYKLCVLLCHYIIIEYFGSKVKYSNGKLRETAECSFDLLETFFVLLFLVMISSKSSTQ